MHDKSFGQSEAKKVLEEKYSAIVCQNRIRQELMVLNLSKTMELECCTPNEALENVQDKITAYLAQGPKNPKV